MNITATGQAKIKQAQRLGNFIYYKTGLNGKAIYEQASRINDPNYVYYVEEHEQWGVRNYLLFCKFFATLVIKSKKSNFQLMVENILGWL